MKFAVDRLWQYYVAESAGKIRSNAEGCAGRKGEGIEVIIYWAKGVCACSAPAVGAGTVHNTTQSSTGNE